MSLVTFEDVRKYINQHDENDIKESQRVVIEDLILKVSKAFSNHCGCNLEATTYTEYLDGNSSDKLFTLCYPIISVSGIFEDTSREWAASTEIDSEEYFVIGENYVLMRNYTLNSYPKSVKIVYTAGYSTIPEDLKLACIMEVVRIYKNKYMSNNVGITSTAVEGITTTYDTGAFLPDTMSTLEYYKNKRFA
jgi:hypothetical protein